MTPVHSLAGRTPYHGGGLRPVGVVDGVYPSLAPTNPTVAPPNQYDGLLEQEAKLMISIVRAGGLQEICCPSNYKYAKPPYLVMPPEGRQYQQINSIALPADPSGDVIVLQFRVPTGYDGVITSIVNFYTGTGFVEGSGDLIWRLKVGQKWARNLGEINTTLGSLTSPCQLFRGGIRVYTEQYITYYANVPTATLSGGRVVCGVFGWYYPI